MLSLGNEKMKCFEGGIDYIIEEFRSRLFLDLNEDDENNREGEEEEIKKKVLSLISTSYNHWTTNLYDYYQYKFQNIY